jgi:F-type H+-transporting ATPase subunit epsilon
MAELLTCDVVTPEKKFFSAEASFVVVPAEEGEMGVYYQHAPTISTIGSGAVRITVEGEAAPLQIAVFGGYTEIDGTKVTVLADRAALVSEVDSGAVNEKISELEGKLSVLDSEDAGRAFVEDEIAWNKLLLHLKGE